MKRIVPALFVVACCSCGGGPTTPSSSSGAPLPAPVDYSGLWSANFRYTSCDGERHCVLRIGTTQPFTLRLQQHGASLQGVFTTWQYAVDVEGEVLKDGSIVLSGGAPAASDKDDDGALTVTRIEGLADPGGRLSGTLAYEIRPGGTATEYYSQMSVRGTIESASRSDLQMFASTFDGTWSGRFVVKACDPIGSAIRCYPYDAQETTPIEVALNGNSGTVTIGPAHVPVTAKANGASITLEGEVVIPQSGGGERVRVSHFSATRDSFGRMVGSFEYVSEWPAGAPTFGETAHVELWQVVKVP